MPHVQVAEYVPQGNQNKDKGDKNGNGKGNGKGNTSTAAASTAAATTTAAAAATATTDVAAAAASQAQQASPQDLQSSLTLDPGQVQPGLANDGQAVPAAGQVSSLTSVNNLCVSFHAIATTSRMLSERK